MELETRLVFIDTSAYQAKQFLFGHYALDTLQGMVEDGRLHLLITDVIRSEVESHLIKFTEDAVSAYRKMRKAVNFLQITREPGDGEFLPAFSREPVLSAAMRKFHALLETNNVEIISVSTVDPKTVFEQYFSRRPPFHRDAKKHEFPDAFSLAAVAAVAAQRHHRVYVVSLDGDMSAVAETEPAFLPLTGIDALLDLVNRNDEQMADLSRFADSVLEMHKQQVLEHARTRLSEMEFVSFSEDGGEYEVYQVTVDTLSISDLQLIDVSRHDATYDITFDTVLTAEYEYTDYSNATWDREDRVYYNVTHESSVYRHKTQLEATLALGFDDGLIADSEIVSFFFEDSMIVLDIDDAEFIR